MNTQRDTYRASVEATVEAVEEDSVQHTPTPWSYRRAKFTTDGEYDCGISAVIDGKPYCIAEAVGRCAPTVKLPAEANAAFIVEAVNNYDILRAQLATARKALEEVRIIIGPAIPVCDCMTCRAIARINAALNSGEQK